MLYCLRFALPLDKISCTSTIKINEFILYCLRFALSLQRNLPREFLLVRGIIAHYII